MTFIRNITLDANDPYELATFWAAVLGWQLDPEAVPGDDEVGIVGGDGPPNLLFEKVPEPKTAKSRMHLDIQPQITRDEELDRVLALGAKIVEDFRTPDGGGWIWCEDPEGNAFCVVRSAAERERQGQAG